MEDRECDVWPRATSIGDRLREYKMCNNASLEVARKMMQCNAANVICNADSELTVQKEHNRMANNKYTIKHEGE